MKKAIYIFQAFVAPKFRALGLFFTVFFAPKGLYKRYIQQLGSHNLHLAPPSLLICSGHKATYLLLFSNGSAVDTKGKWQELFISGNRRGAAARLLHYQMSHVKIMAAFASKIRDSYLQGYREGTKFRLGENSQMQCACFLLGWEPGCLLAS